MSKEREMMPTAGLIVRIIVWWIVWIVWVKLMKEKRGIIVTVQYHPYGVVSNPRGMHFPQDYILYPTLVTY